MTTPLVQEWDASGKPIAASPVQNQTEWDANGKPIISAPAAPAAPPPETGLHSLLTALGLPGSVAEIKQQQQAQQQQMQDHPVVTALKALAGPAGQVGEGIYNQGKQSVQQAILAAQALRAGNPAQATVNAVSAVPLVGPALVKAANQAPALTGGYAHQIGQVVTNPGAMGTIAGTAAAAAPIVAGGVDAALPERSLIGAIPSKTDAGAIFNDLNDKLANHPVPLNSALAPLQRAVEIGGRGSTLPKAVLDLLQRSESPNGTPMTFPEARDYQGALSDLSQSDKLAMNGRMRGAVAQLNKGLFDDIHNAATSGGMGDEYQNAMKQYAQASKLQAAAKTAGKLGITAVGLGEGYRAAKALMGAK